MMCAAHALIEPDNAARPPPLMAWHNGSRSMGTQSPFRQRNLPFKYVDQRLSSSALPLWVWAEQDALDSPTVALAEGLECPAAPHRLPCCGERLVCLVGHLFQLVTQRVLRIARLLDGDNQDGECANQLIHEQGVGLGRDGVEGEELLPSAGEGVVWEVGHSCGSENRRADDGKRSPSAPIPAIAHFLWA